MDKQPDYLPDYIMECEAVIFDLDGVLLDSTNCILRHWKNWADLHGIDIHQVEAVAHGRRTLETIQLVAPHLDAVHEAKLFAENEASDMDGIISIPGAVELLRMFPEGKWAIATSGTQRLAAARLKYGSLPVPKILISADDVSNGKPHPEPYLTAAHWLGVEPKNCAVVEDSPAGIASALAAGMRVVGVVSTHPANQLNRSTIIAPSLMNIQVSTGRQHPLALRINHPIMPNLIPVE